MRRLATAGLLGYSLIVLFAGTAAAKGDAMAALDAPIPSGVDPGTELAVGWRAWTPGGTDWPFAGLPVFIRLISADGTSSTEVLGRENPRGSGHYLARVVVPPGGVGLVEVGLFGESCVDGMCTRSDILFDLPEQQRAPATAAPVTEDPPIPTAPGPAAVRTADTVRPPDALPAPDTIALALATVAGAVTLSLLLGRPGTRARSRPRSARTDRQLNGSGNVTRAWRDGGRIRADRARELPIAHETARNSARVAKALRAR
jgi:hypothetical protein